MSSLFDAFMELLDLLDRLVKAVCVFLAAVMAVVVIIQVTARYLPTQSPPWTEELARYLMIAMAYIGASAGVRRWNNIYVDFLINRLPPRVYRVAMFLIQFFVLIFIIYISYLCIKVYPVVGSRQYSTTLRFPLLVPQSTIIIGTILMSLQLIGVLINSLRKEQKDD